MSHRICFLSTIFRIFPKVWRPQTYDYAYAITCHKSQGSEFDVVVMPVVAGAGSIVPITGFANSVASPAIEFKTEGLVYGMAAKMFIVAGPIIVFGVVAGTAVGLIYMLL